VFQISYYTLTALLTSGNFDVANNFEPYIVLAIALFCGVIFLQYFVIKHAKTLPAPQWRSASYRVRLAAVSSGAMATIPLILYICGYSFDVPFKALLLPAETAFLSFAMWDYFFKGKGHLS
jgi:hypothetical protein